MSQSPWRHSRETIRCCKYCKPPKRFPGCGDTCKEYKEEKAKYVADMQKYKVDRESHPALNDYDFNKYVT